MGVLAAFPLVSHFTFGLGITSALEVGKRKGSKSVVVQEYK